MSKSALSKQSNSRVRSLSAIDLTGRKTSLKLVKQEEDLGNRLHPLARQKTEEFLREVVDACASSVAVLDELGSQLYASKSWHLFERAYGLHITLPPHAQN